MTSVCPQLYVYALVATLWHHCGRVTQGRLGVTLAKCLQMRPPNI